MSPTRRVSERPKRHGRQIADRQMQDRDVRVRVLADDGGFGDAPVGQLHADRIGAGDHVLIGDDGACPIDDHAGAEAAFDALPVARPIIAEQLIERRDPRALGDQARGVDIDHGRSGARHRICEARHGRRSERGDVRDRRSGRGLALGNRTQQFGFPPHQQKRRRQADYCGSDLETAKSASVVQLISLPKL